MDRRVRHRHGHVNNVGRYEIAGPVGARDRRDPLAADAVHPARVPEPIGASDVAGRDIVHYRVPGVRRDVVEGQQATQQLVLLLLRLEGEDLAPIWSQ
eukprot:1299125-Pleurochrysis_carterae.AAC.1